MEDNKEILDGEEVIITPEMEEELSCGAEGDEQE